MIIIKPTQNSVWNKAKVVKYLKESDEFLVRAIKQIQLRQTQDEQAHAVTMYKNGRGFNKGDGYFFAGICAKLETRTFGQLSLREQVESRERMMKYANQLVNVIKEKEIKT